MNLRYACHQTRTGSQTHTFRNNEREADACRGEKPVRRENGPARRIKWGAASNATENCPPKITQERNGQTYKECRPRQRRRRLITALRLKLNNPNTPPARSWKTRRKRASAPPKNPAPSNAARLATHGQEPLDLSDRCPQRLVWAETSATREVARRPTTRATETITRGGPKTSPRTRRRKMAPLTGCSASPLQTSTQRALFPPRRNPLDGKNITQRRENARGNVDGQIARKSPLKLGSSTTTRPHAFQRPAWAARAGILICASRAQWTSWPLATARATVANARGA